MGDSLPRVRAGRPLTLADRELHVWRASLDLPAELLQRLAKTLSANEHEWTGKEAYVKARGEGLSFPLRDFSIGFLNREQVLRDEKGRAWSCYALEPAPGFAGAVVAAGEGWTLKYYDWSAGVEIEASASLPI